MTEQELKTYKIEWPKTEEEMLAIIRPLIKRSHDYGTCVYAMAIAAEAAFKYVSSELGATGFQAGCADMEALKRLRGLKHGFAMIDYNNILFPQLSTPDHFPTAESILESNKKYFKEEAQKLMDEGDKDQVHVDVWNHWERLANLNVEESK